MIRHELEASSLSEKVCELVIRANTLLPYDVMTTLARAKKTETGDTAQNILAILLENARIARAEGLPICQDTGIYAVFLEIGPDVLIKGDLGKAINDGIKAATQKGLLRASVCHPLTRKNSFDNTPAIVHTLLVQRSGLKLTVFPKGCGSENMSALKMLPPSSGTDGIVDFVVNRVKEAGPNPCPPGMIGIGIGGTMEMAALLSKKALLRPIGVWHEDEQTASLEKDIFKRINALGIGPQGLGGITTTLHVAIETYPCHIASLPVAINIQCHAARKASATFEHGRWKDEDNVHDSSSVTNTLQDLGQEYESIGFKDALPIQLPLDGEKVAKLRAGDRVMLSGPLLVGRDQTHKRLCELMAEAKPLPVELAGQTIYYMGPSPAPPGRVIGSAGPTTSYRMDSYTPAMLQHGVLGFMGKGRRSRQVIEEMARHGAVYLATIGGAGAYLSGSIKSCRPIAFEELGPEALFRIDVDGFPAVVINDIEGNDYYDMVIKGHQA